jgi:hypothetical protein
VIGRLRALPILACAAAALALAAGSAAAATEELPAVPEDFSAADQYVESVPSGDGGRPANAGGGGGGAAALPAAAGVKLPKGGAIERVATSTSLGAPTRKLEGGGAGSPSVPSAAVSAVDGDGFGLLWLLVALAAGSFLLLAAALARRRRGEAGSG